MNTTDHCPLYAQPPALASVLLPRACCDTTVGSWLPFPQPPALSSVLLPRAWWDTTVGLLLPFPQPPALSRSNQTKMHRL